MEPERIELSGLGFNGPAPTQSGPTLSPRAGLLSVLSRPSPRDSAPANSRPC